MTRSGVNGYATLLTMTLAQPQKQNKKREKNMSNDHHDAPHGWRRWLLSTNHKDIGTMYIIFAIASGLVGGIFSLMFRMQLAHPGSTFLGGDHQLFNVLISAHGIIMVFFLSLIHI